MDESHSGMLSFAMGLRDLEIDVFASRAGVNHGMFDSILIVNPLTGPESFEAEPGVKYVLIGESFTWLWAIDWGGGMEGREPRSSPMNDFASESGLVFTHYTIYDPAGNTIPDSFRPLIFHDFDFNYRSYRCGLLLNTSAMNVLARASQYAWSELLDVSEKNSYQLGVMDYRRTSCIMYDGTVFGMSDTDPLTNAHIMEDGMAELVGSISFWMGIKVDSGPRNRLFSQDYRFTVRAAASATNVSATMPDGSLLLMEYDKGKDIWSGYIPITSDVHEGNHTATITVHGSGDIVYVFDHSFTIEKSFPSGYTAVILVLSLVAVASLFLIRRKRKAGGP